MHMQFYTDVNEEYLLYSQSFFTVPVNVASTVSVSAAPIAPTVPSTSVAMKGADDAN